MDHRPTVKVYHYRYFDLETQAMRLAPHKATAEAIAAHPNSELLHGTEHDVESDEIDAQGRYRRIASGWGELD